MWSGYPSGFTCSFHISMTAKNTAIVWSRGFLILMLRACPLTRSSWTLCKQIRARASQVHLLQSRMLHHQGHPVQKQPAVRWIRKLYSNPKIKSFDIPDMFKTSSPLAASARSSSESSSSIPHMFATVPHARDSSALMAQALQSPAPPAARGGIKAFAEKGQGG